jgi:hypothetical protein
MLSNGWSEAGGPGTLFVLGREAAPALEKANDARTIGARSRVAAAVSIFFVCGMGRLAVGGVHGRFLVRMING